MDRIVIILILSFILLFFVYLFIISPMFRKTTFMTVKLPKKAMNKAYSKSKREKKEVALIVDYEANSKNPQHIRKKVGSNNSVFAITTRDDEMLIHTHPKVKTRNGLQANYENTLRERPSEADLRNLERSKRRTDLLITPSGKTIQYSKTRQNTNAKGLNRVDMKLQEKYSSQITNESQARNSAQKVNKEWIKEAESRGFKIREVRKSQKEIKTEVR